MPFLEHTFLDPGASALAANRRRRAAPSAPAGSLPHAGAASEDAELAAAIAASLEPKAESGLTSAGRAAGAAPAQSSGSDAPPAAAARGEAAAGPIAAAAVAAEAAARLPVETSGPGSCRVGEAWLHSVQRGKRVEVMGRPAEVRGALASRLTLMKPSTHPPTAIRCPDGSRLQRRFQQTAPLETLRDLCIASCPEAAAGRPFFLAPSFPGTLRLPGGGPGSPSASQLTQPCGEPCAAQFMLGRRGMAHGTVVRWWVAYTLKPIQHPFRPAHRRPAAARHGC